MSLHVVLARYLLAALGARPLGSLGLALVGVEVSLEGGIADLLVANIANSLGSRHSHTLVKELLQREGGGRGLLNT